MAPACPQCGAPIAGASEAKAAGASLTTIQETSKRLKLHILLSVVVFCASLIWMFAAAGVSDEDAILPTFVVGFSLSWYIATRFRIWWHHK